MNQTEQSDDGAEDYLLLLLSDANLPTGSFVASSGLESFVKHGFFTSTSGSQSEAAIFDSPPHPVNQTPLTRPPPLAQATINFIRDSLNTYAHSSLPFVRAVPEALCSFQVSSTENGSTVKQLGTDGLRVQSSLRELVRFDMLYDSVTLNHVTRRASKSQGVALLTLYSKGFTRPSWVPPKMDLAPPPTTSPRANFSGFNEGLNWSEKEKDALIDELKLMVRRGSTPGHLPICWAVLTFCLGLGRERSQYLHLFLHARALLSASIRLNTIGPYAAQQMLLHVVKPLVDNTMVNCRDLKIRWKSPAEMGDLEQVDNNDDGPSTTWPLGEILAGRHDLQHSRIFNS